MRFQDLNEEQKKKARKLMYSYFKNQAFIGLKVGGLLFLANLIVAAANVLYVHNDVFVIAGAIMNAIFILPILPRDTEKEHDRVNEEAKKIIESRSSKQETKDDKEPV